MPPKATLQDIVAKINRLPEPPEVALRTNQLLEDPETNAEQLAQVIRPDPGLTAQVLRLCNSAGYGMSRKITTVKEAVAILGFNTLRSMFYAIISHSALNVAVHGYSLESGALWHNSLTCAVYAKHLAEKHRIQVDPEQAFTGALLRDIGKLVLGDYVGGNYQEIEAAAVQNKIDFMEAEERIIGFNHTVVGLKIAEKWKLPDKYLKTIRYHHKPSLAAKQVLPADFNLITLVHLADVLTMMLGHGMGGDGMMYSLDYKALELAGIDVSGVYLENTMASLVDLNDTVQSMAESFKGQDN